MSYAFSKYKEHTFVRSNRATGEEKDRVRERIKSECDREKMLDESFLLNYSALFFRSAGKALFPRMMIVIEMEPDDLESISLFYVFEQLNFFFSKLKEKE